MVRLRVRIRFSKQGDLRFIGHRDLMRCMERLFRRAGMPLGFSEGFHPKPRMTFPLALAVGIEGLDEVMEVELATDGKGDCPHLPERPAGCSAQMGTVPFSGAGDCPDFRVNENGTVPLGALLERLTAETPAGLVIRSVEVLPEGSRKARIQGVAYEVPIPSSHRAGLAERIERLLAAESWTIERDRGRPAIDLRPLVIGLSFDGALLTMQLRVTQQGSVGPREVLAALGLSNIERAGVRLCRTAVELSA